MVIVPSPTVPQSDETLESADVAPDSQAVALPPMVAAPETPKEAADPSPSVIDGSKANEAAQDLKDLESMLQTAGIFADEMLTVYDRPWRRGDPVLLPLAASQGSPRLFVCPSPANSRALPDL